ncbi:MAG: hypothetical protein IT203_08540 [Fimbriimonadaceae bacterium]|nr:hypothetical protein [Fimbriimonadaceae bacterium]
MTGDSKNEFYSWVVRPYESSPKRRVVVFGVAGFVLLFGVFIVRLPLLGLLGFGMILASTMEYWLGTSYRLDAKCAKVRTGASVSEIEWASVKRVVLTESGIKLSPLEKEGRLDPFRGVFLKFGGDNREQILDAVRRFGESDVRSLEE